VSQIASDVQYHQTMIVPVLDGQRHQIGFREVFVSNVKFSTDLFYPVYLQTHREIIFRAFPELKSYVANLPIPHTRKFIQNQIIGGWQVLINVAKLNYLFLNFHHDGRLVFSYKNDHQSSINFGREFMNGQVIFKFNLFQRMDVKKLMDILNQRLMWLRPLSEDFFTKDVVSSDTSLLKVGVKIKID